MEGGWVAHMLYTKEVKVGTLSTYWPPPPPQPAPEYTIITLLSISVTSMCQRWQILSSIDISLESSMQPLLGALASFLLPLLPPDAQVTQDSSYECL